MVGCHPATLPALTSSQAPCSLPFFLLTSKVWLIIPVQRLSSLSIFQAKLNVVAKINVDMLLGSISPNHSNEGYARK